MRPRYGLALAVVLPALHATTAPGSSGEHSLPALDLAVMTGPLPPPISGFRGDFIIPASLTFSVSVCLDDFEYSLACRERSLFEAAKRLEQIFLDDYRMGRVAGTLNIWFAVAAEHSEQLHFLREVEDRAIESVTKKLKDDIAGSTASSTNSQISGNAEDAAAQIAQQVQRWHDDAGTEAHNGSNWSHDWVSRTHTYKPGRALYELVRIGNRSR